MSLVREEYFSEEFTLKFKNAFTSRVEFFDSQTGACVSHTPFTHCILPNIVKVAAGSNFGLCASDKLPGNALIQKVRHELLEESLIEFSEKWNDLHDFYQSKDFAKSVLERAGESGLAQLLDGFLLDTAWHDQVSALTGIPLDIERGPDIAAQIYDQGSRLLCHDDALEGRRIAYILYLVEDEAWTEKDGGSLDLFNMDERGSPREIVKSIYPRGNTLAFFEVTPASHHQVREILTATKSRLSITGWFYGPEPHHSKEKFIQKFGKKFDYDWTDDSLTKVLIQEIPQTESLVGLVHPQYLKDHIREAVRNCFLSDEPISLISYLTPDTFKSFKRQFLNLVSDADWLKKGPPNWRSYASLSRVEFSRKDVNEFLLEKWTRLGHLNYWADLTGIVVDKEKLSIEVEVQRYKSGDYQLLHDDFSMHEEKGLDLYYFIIPGNGAASQWDEGAVGGNFCISYPPNAKGGAFQPTTTEENEVTLVTPKDNMLIIMKRDPLVQSSIAYIKKSAQEELIFYCIYIKILFQH